MEFDAEVQNTPEMVGPVLPEKLKVGFYKIKSGDTLGEIAKAIGTTKRNRGC